MIDVDNRIYHWFYLHLLSQAGFCPNTYMSSEWMNMHHLESSTNYDGVWGITAADNDAFEWEWPPVYADRSTADHLVFPDTSWHTGFPITTELRESLGLALHSRQYIYDPANGWPSDGWAAKQVSKWMANHKDELNKNEWQYVWVTIADNKPLGIADFLKKNKVCHQNHALFSQCMYGAFRCALIHNGDVVGLNVADINWRFVNLRAVVGPADIQFQVYMRYLFFVSPWLFDESPMPRHHVIDAAEFETDDLDEFKRNMEPAMILDIPTKPER